MMAAPERFVAAVEEYPLVLAEAAVCERLRRMEHILLHPTLFNTPLIYEESGRRAMEEIYGQYRQIALDAGVPVLLCAPTWRVDRERVRVAGVPAGINRDAVEFMQELRDRWDDSGSPVLVGGLVGPKNDCYRPDEGLNREEALEFHRWQVEDLARSGVDVLLAQTLPALPEAEGIGRAMAASGLPYLLSFVIDRYGRVLDGTPLAEAVELLDGRLGAPPYGYMVNCAHPSFLCADNQPAALFGRLLGIQANSSSRDQLDLDGSDRTQRDSLEEWVELMLMLNRIYNLKILGGCCGTDERYLHGLVRG